MVWGSWLAGFLSVVSFVRRFWFIGALPAVASIAGANAVPMEIAKVNGRGRSTIKN
jgi:hypothetical protein